jgi:predicted transposase/invertase (TIGR01784 family)
MRTDTIFYQLFQTFPTLLFELVGLPPETADGYQFLSAEVKEKSFRFDGIFLPDQPENPIWFVEVQFQPDPHFYSKFFSEIFIYLNQFKPVQDWRMSAIWASRTLETDSKQHYRELFTSGRVVLVYLDEIVKVDSPALGLVKLIMTDENGAIPFAKELVSKFSDNTVLELVETVLVYKFKDKTREEIEAMFSLGDLKQTRVYMDAKQDGVREGKRQTILRQLTRKFGTLPPDTVSKIENLSIVQLESLAEAILDMQSIVDIVHWL